MMYRAIYKCRLCGKIYAGREVNKENARFICVSLRAAEYETDTESGFSIYRVESHHCKDDSYGMADFQGFKKVKD